MYVVARLAIVFFVYPRKVFQYYNLVLGLYIPLLYLIRPVQSCIIILLLFVTTLKFTPCTCTRAYMYVCMFVCMYVCMYVCIYVYVYVRMCT